MHRASLAVYPALIALAACSDGEISAPSGSAAGSADSGSQSASEGDGSSGERVAMAETGWLAIGMDGSVYTTQLDADGTYRDYSNGELVQTGTWKRSEDGSLCFTPAAENRYGACWETEGLEDDGTMRATNASGKAIELRRIAYVPPGGDGGYAEAEADVEEDTDEGEEG